MVDRMVNDGKDEAVEVRKLEMSRQMIVWKGNGTQILPPKNQLSGLDMRFKMKWLRVQSQ